jgi:hypothetical protein
MMRLANFKDSFLTPSQSQREKCKTNNDRSILGVKKLVILIMSHFFSDQKNMGVVLFRYLMLERATYRK